MTYTILCTLSYPVIPLSLFSCYREENFSQNFKIAIKARTGRCGKRDATFLEGSIWNGIKRILHAIRPLEGRLSFMLLWIALHRLL